MRIFIVEDEINARDRLIDMLMKVNADVQIVGKAESVAQAVRWIKDNPKPDLAFFDIQLTDDYSFQIFEEVNVTFPIIFTTAFDEYVLKSLEHNSIDYLVKPLTEDRLQKALDKTETLKAHYEYHNVSEELQAKRQKKRFLVKKGIDRISVEVSRVAYFFTEHKVAFLRDMEGTTYISDATITELTDQVDPTTFFRANRKYLVNIDAIAKFKSDQGKIILDLNPPPGDDVTVSKENAPNFRKWIEEQ